MGIDPRALQIYTDGSSKVHLGCKAGCAFAVVYPEHTNISDIKSVGISYDQSKIGAMEIQGINWALDWLSKNTLHLKNLDITSAVIFCDNDCVVSSANTYINGWMQNGWKKKDGGDIANLDAWKRYISLKKKLSVRVEIKWIKGKTIEPTKIVDQLAKSSADRIPQYGTQDYMRGKYADRLKGAVLFKEAHDASDALIRVYYHQSVNKTKNSECKVYFEVIENGSVKNTCIAYCTKDFDRKYIDRKNYYRAKFRKVNQLRTIFTYAEKIEGEELELMKIKMKEAYGRC